MPLAKRLKLYCPESSIACISARAALCVGVGRGGAYLASTNCRTQNLSNLALNVGDIKGQKFPYRGTRSPVCRDPERSPVLLSHIFPGKRRNLLRFAERNKIKSGISFIVKKPGVNIYVYISGTCCGVFGNDASDLTAAYYARAKRNIIILTPSTMSSY